MTVSWVSLTADRAPSYEVDRKAAPRNQSAVVRFAENICIRHPP